MSTPPRRTAARARACAVGLAALVAALGCSRPAPPPAPDPGTGALGLRVAASQPEYRTGDTVRLTITMTDTQGAECRVSRSATGSVTILDLTRDGGPVEPALGSARTYRDFSASIAESLVAVAPGGSLDVALPADPGPPPALVTYAADGRGGASTVRWPLDRPGAYHVVVGYQRPPLTGVPTDPCSASARSGSADFRVTGG